MSGDSDGLPVTLDRVETGRGELVLRAAGERFEIISNGVFLMDTSDGESERLLVDAAVSRCAVPNPRVLIGGLGVGFSLRRAADHRQVAAIDVVEIEGTVIGWHERFLRHLTGEVMGDSRVRVIEADILDWLARADGTYDAICLDTDNGPGWLVFERNAEVYAAGGLDLAYELLNPSGVLAVWSASRDGEYEKRLRDRFGEVEVLETPRERGEPDIVYVARRSGLSSGIPL